MQALPHHLHQRLVVDFFVPEPIQNILRRHTTEFLDHLHQMLHLHEGLDPGGLVNIRSHPLDHSVIQPLVRTEIAIAQDRPDHRRLHDLLPALTQRG